MSWINSTCRVLHSLLLCGFVLLLCCCNGESGSQPGEKPATPTAGNSAAIDVLTAVEKRKLRLDVRIAPNGRIALDMRSISSQPLELAFDQGYIARCKEKAVSCDRMIVETFRHSFKPYEKLVKTLKAYGTTDSPIPAAGSRVEFYLERVDSDDPLYLAAEYLIKNSGTKEKTARLMIWAAAERMSFNTLVNIRAPSSDELYITGKDYSGAMSLLDKAGVMTRNLQFSIDKEKLLLDLTNKLREGDKTTGLKAIALLAWFYQTPGTAEVLVEVLEEGSNPAMREKAALALGESGITSMAATLLETIISDPVKNVRRAAAFSLLTLGDIRGVPLTIMFLGESNGDKLVPPEINDKLIELTGEQKTTSGEWELWWVTEGGWDWLKSRRADIGSARNAMEAQHRFIREPASEAASLIKSEDEEAVLEWLRKLHSEEGRRKLTDPDVFDRIIEIGTKTNSAAVALNIAWILRGMKEPGQIAKGKKALLAMLAKKGNRPSYRDIISVLAQWKAMEAVELLLFLLEDKEFGEPAAEALKKITGKRINSSDPEEWQKALSEHGGSIKDDFIKRLKEQDQKKLMQALSDLASSMYRRLWTDPDIYKALLGAASNIKTWEQLNAIVPVLTVSKNNPRTQRALTQIFNGVESLDSKRVIIETLAEHFPNGDTVDFMLELLEGDKRRLKMNAREALYKITGAQSSKRLRTKSDWIEYFSKHPAARWGKK